MDEESRHCNPGRADSVSPFFLDCRESSRALSGRRVVSGHVTWPLSFACRESSAGRSGLAPDATPSSWVEALPPYIVIPEFPFRPRSVEGKVGPTSVGQKNEFSVRLK